MVMYFVMVLLASNVTALAQPPDNAALLYRQAFQLHEDPNKTMRWMLGDFSRGEIASNEAITRYIEGNRRVIDLVVKAADIPKCDWDYDYSKGINMEITNLAPLYRIACLLVVEARWLAEQGTYTTALDRCVTLRKIALHTCDGRLGCYLSGNQTNTMANEAVQYVLGLMSGDVDELNRFKSRLIQTQEQFPSLAHYIMLEAHAWVAMMQKDKVQPILDIYKEGSLAGYSMKPVLERIRKGDDTFFERNRNYYLNAASTVVGTLESGLPYTQICTKLDGLVEQWSREEEEDNPDAIFTAYFFPMRTGLYQSTVRQQNHVNAIKTAIDLYIVKIRTGQLPDTLPADSPPDLFSGKSFAYVKTAEGFILRCQGKEDPKKDEVHEYEFKAK